MAGEEYQGETRVNGQAGGVMRAAASLVEALENRGVGVVFDETLHDSPSYDNALWFLPRFHHPNS